MVSAEEIVLATELYRFARALFGGLLFFGGCVIGMFGSRVRIGMRLEVFGLGCGLWVRIGDSARGTQQAEQPPGLSCAAC